MDFAHGHRAAAARRGWGEYLAAATKVRAYALAAARSQPAAEREALHASAASAVASLAYVAPRARAILDQQLAQIAAGDASTDLAANEAALRLLCVRAELVSGVTTPPEDTELRREYQMQRLVASMQRGERVTPAEIDDLALEWLVVGPVEATTHDALFARFERCRRAGSTTGS